MDMVSNHVIEESFVLSKIISQQVNGESHYSAVFLPSNYDENKEYPALVLLNGLNQFDPIVRVEQNPFKGIRRGLKDYIIMIPSFRGQAIIYRNKSYCSDGFFGDAFDGAATDALRTLQLCKELFSIDEQRIAVAGQSRGGTVALLMGARDTSINTVIDVTGPINFYDRKIYYKFGMQYKYQFLSRDQSLSEIRRQIIASSPVYFIEKYKKPMLIVYSENDRTVSIENAEILIDKFAERSNFKSIILNEGHNVNSTGHIIEWLEQYND